MRGRRACVQPECTGAAAAPTACSEAATQEAMVCEGAKACSLSLQATGLFEFSVPSAVVESEKKKVDAIRGWGLPRYTSANVQKFIDFASYNHNMITCLSRVATPLEGSA